MWWWSCSKEWRLEVEVEVEVEVEGLLSLGTSPWVRRWLGMVLKVQESRRGRSLRTQLLGRSS